MSIYQQRLQTDLDNINDQTRRMGDLVQASIRNAVRAFLDGDESLANMTVLSDNVINRKMREIDDQCHRFIARHLPSAGHLRLISSIIRLNIILERIGDYAVTISRESLLFGTLEDGLMTQIDLIANEATQMLNQSLRAFYDRNAEMARVTMNMSDHMENTMDSIYNSLGEHRDRYPGKRMFALFATLTQLKRVTDQARNICEETVFVVTGEDKKRKIFNILFLDLGNTHLSLLAEAIGNRHYSHCARFSSAGSAPSEHFDPQAIEFLHDHGLTVNKTGPQKSDFSELELAQFQIIVAVEGTVKSHISQIPFHTAFIDWEFDDFPSLGSDEEIFGWYQQSYRELTHKITELMELMHGEQEKAG